MAKELQSTPSLGSRSFEGLKRINEHGAEYWSARDLQGLLGYGQWRRFEEAIQRARTSCEQSGNPAENHFAGAGKMVVLGSSSRREVADFYLSRFACYLIAQNGDPRKPEIAAAQRRRRRGSSLLNERPRVCAGSAGSGAPHKLAIRSPPR